MSALDVPSANSRDYALTATAAILLCSWVAGLVGGLDAFFVHHDMGPLSVAIGASIGYLWTIQFIMQRSQYVTYLWLRHIQRREFSRS